jgi:hypothetical protein
LWSFPLYGCWEYCPIQGLENCMPKKICMSDKICAHSTIIWLYQWPIITHHHPLSPITTHHHPWGLVKNPING